jgi:hypothetical protein
MCVLIRKNDANRFTLARHTPSGTVGAPELGHF